MKNLWKKVLCLASAVMLLGCVVPTAMAENTDVITVDVYDVAANYQGISSGWFAKIIKDKFNLELNIIAPQVSGNGAALYQTRCANGNLGDIVILDNGDMLECVQAGLIKDISDTIWQNADLTNYKAPISMFNAQIDETGKVYAIPCGMCNTSPKECSSESLIAMPLLPWDYYTEQGRPEMKTMDDLLDVLEKMMQDHPVNQNGDKAYAITMWSDWDGESMGNLNELCYWFGSVVYGSLVIGADGTMTPLASRDSQYYRNAKFFNAAYRRGLIDPDSVTQDWNTVAEKMKNKRVYLLWSSWMNGFYNNDTRNNEGKNYIYVPVGELKHLVTSDSYYGGSRCFGVGAQVEGEKYERIMAFLNWYASSESVYLQSPGIRGFNYDVDENGKCYLLNPDALSNDTPVPAEYGSFGYSSGGNQLNQWIVSSASIDPATGERYASTYWSSTKQADVKRTDKEWRELYGADTVAAYCDMQGTRVIVPSTNLMLATDTTDIALLRSECKNAVLEYSWRAVFAEDDASFEALWDSMLETLAGLDYNELTAFDMAKYQPMVDVWLRAE